MNWLDEPTTSIPTAEERELIQLDQAKSLVRRGRDWSERMTKLNMEAAKGYANSQPREAVSTLEQAKEAPGGYDPESP